jgi:hypothetical protein
MPNSELPLFCGEFFSRVLSPTGTVLPDACADSVRVLRQLLYLFYKYELPYLPELEQKVISQFEKTEDDISGLSDKFATLSQAVDDSTFLPRRRYNSTSQKDVTREARILLSRVFSGFDFTNIQPRHGPGVVATKQKLWGKYQFTNVSRRIASVYPVDAYFYASAGHVCDHLSELQTLGDRDFPAKVILVPKDSRGPRLISCEPVDFQWIQQGISRSLVRHVESLNLTRFNVFFTDQGPNQRGALLGSSTGRYATLDLNEASDRISLDVVRLLFPKHVYDILENVRSSSTVLPSGKELTLKKFAPMGSALCFPILALTVWAILTAAAPDADTRQGILVYGDDVIVPTAFAVNAMEQLESFGLKINRDKSCISGLFRESCGMDAFNGTIVTPVRFRTVWSSSPSPESYVSWISYANSLYDKKYYRCYDYIVGMLYRLYGRVPDDSLSLTCPSLREVPEYMRIRRWRTHQGLQKRQWLVPTLRVPTIRREIRGWEMLLRFFAETNSTPDPWASELNRRDMGGVKPPFSVRSYTKRRTSMLVRRWC